MFPSRHCALTSDDKWGERPRAFVVLRPEAQSADHDAVGEAIIAHCRARIAGDKVPRDILILHELPRTSTGKIRKNALREEAWTGKSAKIN